MAKDGGSYRPKWQAVSFMKCQNNRNNNEICLTVGPMQTFLSFLSAKEPLGWSGMTHQLRGMICLKEDAMLLEKVKK